MKTNDHAPSARLHHWLQLLRAPNLLTVPGDAAAGCVLAAAWMGLAPPFWRMLLAALCSLLLYAFGLILNDVVDLRADRRNRSGRPLAEGRISLAAAMAAGIAAAALAILLAFRWGTPPMFRLTVALAVAVCAYNLVLKRFAIPGSLAMGACRLLSVLLGAATIKTLAPPALLAAIGVGAYIGFVTWIADREEDFFDFGKTSFGPLAAFALALVPTLGLVAINAPEKRLLFCLIPAGLGLLRVFYLATLLSNGTIAPAVTQRSVGAFIRALIFLQAAFFLMGFGLPATILGILFTVFVWPAARILAHRFYAS